MSPTNRVPTLCPVFAECGGCALQDMTYESQLSKKELSLNTLFATVLPSLPGEHIIVHPSPKELNYRSRMDFIIDQDLRFGLRASGKSFTIVPCSTCLLLSENAQNIFQLVQKFLQDYPGAKNIFSVYDLRVHKGFLRYFSLRESGSGDLMLFFTTTKSVNLEQEFSFLTFLEQVFDLSTAITSAQWIVNNTDADDIGYEKAHKIIGETKIIDTLNGLSFSLGPRTFFQSNRFVAQEMFDKIVSFAEGKVLDVCCGVGSIALSVARSKRVTQVHGVELFKESVIAAEENAKLNNLSNVKFSSADAKDFLFTCLKNKLFFDTIILDPPRVGMSLESMKLLLRLLPKKIIYMSCNPQSLRSDIEPLLTSYEIVSLEAYDMFPQTNHIEALCVLKKK